MITNVKLLKILISNIYSIIYSIYKYFSKARWKHARNDCSIHASIQTFIILFLNILFGDFSDFFITFILFRVNFFIHSNKSALVFLKWGWTTFHFFWIIKFEKHCIFCLLLQNIFVLIMISFAKSGSSLLSHLYY